MAFVYLHNHTDHPEELAAAPPWSSFTWDRSGSAVESLGRARQAACRHPGPPQGLRQGQGDPGDWPVAALVGGPFLAIRVRVPVMPNIRGPWLNELREDVVNATLVAILQNKGV